MIASNLLTGIYVFTVVSREAAEEEGVRGGGVLCAMRQG